VIIVLVNIVELLDVLIIVEELDVWYEVFGYIG